MYNDIVSFMEKYKKLSTEEAKTRLRKKRREMGYQPKFFEQKIGMPAPQFQQLEKFSYRSKPSVESLIKIAYAMNISLDDLMYFNNEGEILNE